MSVKLNHKPKFPDVQYLPIPKAKAYYWYLPKMRKKTILVQIMLSSNILYESKV